jgi:hypothetical protein
VRASKLDNLQERRSLQDLDAGIRGGLRRHLDGSLVSESQESARRKQHFGLALLGGERLAGAQRNAPEANGLPSSETWPSI